MDKTKTRQLEIVTRTHDDNGNLILTLDMAISKLQTFPSARRYAVILHDKDIDTKPHLHIALDLENNRSLHQITGHFNLPVNTISKEYGDERAPFNRICSYMVHRTDNSTHKYQYNLNEVYSNFDFPALLKEIEIQVKKHQISSNINKYIQQVRKGELTVHEIKELLFESNNHATYEKYEKQLLKAQSTWLDIAPMPPHREVYYIESYDNKPVMRHLCAIALCKQFAVNFYNADITKDIYQLDYLVYILSPNNKQQYRGQPIIFVDNVDVFDMYNILDNHENIMSILNHIPNNAKTYINKQNVKITAKYVIINVSKDFETFSEKLSNNTYLARSTGIIRVFEPDIIEMYFNKGLWSDCPQNNNYIRLKHRRLDFVNLIRQQVDSVQIANLESDTFAELLQLSSQINVTKKQNPNLTCEEIDDDIAKTIIHQKYVELAEILEKTTGNKYEVTYNKD